MASTSYAGGILRALAAFRLTDAMVLSFFLAICLRYFLDAIGWGVLGALILLVAAGLHLFVSQRVRVSHLYLAVAITAILVYGYLLVAVNFQAYTYPLRALGRYSSYLAAFIVGYYYLNPKQVYKIFLVLLAFELVVASYQFLVLGNPRPDGTLRNNNQIMYLLVLFAGLTLVWRRRVLFSIAAIAAATLLGGIGGFVATSSIFAVYGFFARTNRERVVALAAVVIVGTGAITLQRRADDLQALQHVERHLDTGKPGGAGSAVWRIVTWRNHISHSVDEGRLLTGFGVDYSSLVSPYSTPVSDTDPHNDYLLILIEFGLFGVLLYLFALLKLIKRFIQSWREMGHRLSGALAITLIGLMIGQIVGNILRQSTLWLVLMPLLAIAFRETEGTSRP